MPAQRAVAEDVLERLRRVSAVREDPKAAEALIAETLPRVRRLVQMLAGPGVERNPISSRIASCLFQEPRSLSWRLLARHVGRPDQLSRHHAAAAAASASRAHRNQHYHRI